MTTIRLYSQPMNPFTEKVASALAQKALAYARVEVTEVDEIKSLSPETQLLPVLEIDEERVAESSEILRWLEALYPEPSLYSPDPTKRRQQETLAEWSDTSFAFYWNRWRIARDERERSLAARSPGLLSRIHQHVGEKIGRDADSPEAPSASEQEIMHEVANRMDDLVGFLGSREYFYSERLSVADIAVYGMLLIMRDGPMPDSASLLEERPTLRAHLERIVRVTRDHERSGKVALDSTGSSSRG